MTDRGDAIRRNMESISALNELYSKIISKAERNAEDIAGVWSGASAEKLITVYEDILRDSDAVRRHLNASYSILADELNRNENHSAEDEVKRS